MKKAMLSVVLGAMCASVGFGQSVTIMPKKQTYRRPKPKMEFKKTFSIRRPIARASTPALSKRITSAIDPVTVLNIRIKDELGDEQWLEESDYKVLYNQKGVLSVECWMEGTAAYPDSVTRHVVVDLRNGERIKPPDVFTDLAGLVRVVKRVQEDEVKKSIVEMRKDPDLKDAVPANLFSDTNFSVRELSEFSVNSSGVTFYYDYGFPHVLQAAQPPGEYMIGWSTLKPFIRRDGLLARFIH